MRRMRQRAARMADTLRIEQETADENERIAILRAHSAATAIAESNLMPRRTRYATGAARNCGCSRDRGRLSATTGGARESMLPPIGATDAMLRRIACRPLPRNFPFVGFPRSHRPRQVRGRVRTNVWRCCRRRLMIRASSATLRDPGRPYDSLEEEIAKDEAPAPPPGFKNGVLQFTTFRKTFLLEGPRDTGFGMQDYLLQTVFGRHSSHATSRSSSRPIFSAHFERAGRSRYAPRGVRRGARVSHSAEAESRLGDGPGLCADDPQRLSQHVPPGVPLDGAVGVFVHAVADLAICRWRDRDRAYRRPHPARGRYHLDADA